MGKISIAKIPKHNKRNRKKGGKFGLLWEWMGKSGKGGGASVLKKSGQAACKRNRV
jgi:hypothetical protein